MSNRVSRRSSRVRVPNRKYEDTVELRTKASTSISSCDDASNKQQSYERKTDIESSLATKERRSEANADENWWTAPLAKSFACVQCNCTFQSYSAIALHCGYDCGESYRRVSRDDTEKGGEDLVSEIAAKRCDDDEGNGPSRDIGTTISASDGEVIMTELATSGILTQAVSESGIGPTDALSVLAANVALPMREDESSTNHELGTNVESGFQLVRVVIEEADSECVESLVELSKSDRSIHGAEAGSRAKGAFQCRCGLIFCTSRALKRHKEAHCDFVVLPKKHYTRAWSVTEKFVCTVCNRGFAHKSNLVRHEKKFGHKDRSAKPMGLHCQYCAKKYSSENLLKRHQRTRCPRLMQCPICFLTREEMTCSLLKHVIHHVRISLTESEEEKASSIPDLCLIEENGNSLAEIFVDAIDDELMTMIAKQILEAEGVRDHTYVIDVARIQSEKHVKVKQISVMKNRENISLKKDDEVVIQENDNLPEKTTTVTKEEALECERCGQRFLHESNLKMHQSMKCLAICQCICPICKAAFESAASLYKHVNEHIRTSLFEPETMTDTNRLILVSETGEALADKINNDNIKLDESKMKAIYLQILEAGERSDTGCYVIDLKRTFNRRTIGNKNGRKENKNGAKYGGQYRRVEWKMKMERLNDGERRCRTCGSVFACEDDFKTHYLHDHSRDCAVCEICAKPFTDEKSLRHHLKVHSDERPHHCDLCPKRFKHRCTMLQHRREHLGENNCVCDICGATFKRAYNLKTHRETTHMDIKPFHCPHCPARFGKKSHWTKHKLIHTAGSSTRRRTKEEVGLLYPCDYCPKVLLTEDGKRSHIMALHTGEGIQCSRCDQKLMTEASFQRHLLVVHGLETEDELEQTPWSRVQRYKRARMQADDVGVVEECEETVVDEEVILEATTEEVILEELVVTDGEMIEIRVEEGDPIIQ